MKSGDRSPVPAAALFGLVDIALAGYAAIMAINILFRPSSLCEPPVCDTTGVTVLGVLAIPVAAGAVAAALLCVRVIRRRLALMRAVRASGMALGVGAVWLITVYSVLTALAIGH